MSIQSRNLAPATIAGLMMMIFSCAGFAAIPADSAAQGGKEQVPQYAPVPSDQVMVASIQYTKKHDDQGQADGQWYRIPKWFAGTWTRKEVTTLKEFDCKNGETTNSHLTVTAVSHDNEGWQQDSNGDCYNRDHTPFRTETVGDTCRQIFIVSKVTPLEVTDDHITKEFIGHGVLIEIATGKIKYSARARSIHTYSKSSNNQMICQSVMTEYDAAGKEIRITSRQAEYKKIAEFRPRDNYGGDDMRFSFRNFLISSGSVNLIPDSIAMAP